jgi:hypothetical protein
MRYLWIAGLLACGRDLSVPPPRAPPAVGVTDFAPHSAWAGTRVTITGHDLGKTTSDTEIRFGQSSRTAPVRVAADGSALDVLVPDDASDGAVQVSNAAGQAQAPAPFAFRGLGRLRQGIVAATADLRPRIETLVGTSGDNLALIAPGSRWAGKYTARGFDELSGPKDAATLAYAKAADTLAAVDRDTTGCTGSSAQLVLDTPATVCLPGPALPGASWTLAIDGAATHALASSGVALWSIDLSGASPVVQRFTVNSAATAALAWAGADHFIVFDDDGLKPFAFSPAPALGAPVDSVSTSAATSIVTDVAAGIAFYCSDGSFEVDKLLLSPWPPVAGPSSGLPLSDCGGLALSADDKRLAIAHPADGSVTLLDVSGAPPWLALNAARVEEPRNLSSSATGFFVAARGGVTQLSLLTGNVLAFHPLNTGLRTPTVRVPDPAAPAVIEIPRNHLNTLLRLDATTLAPLPFLPGGPAEIVLDPLGVDASATDGRALYLLHGFEARKLVAAAGRLPVEDPVSRWLPTDAVGRHAPEVSASADGRTVVYRYDAGTSSAPSWRVSLLDPAVSWGSNYLPPFLPTAEAAGFSARLASDAAGTAWLVDAAQARRLELRTGSVQGAVALDGTPAGALLANQVLFVPELAPSGSASRPIAKLLRIALDGTVTAATHLPAFDQGAGDSSLLLSSSGTRLYFLRGQGDARRLVTAAFDPETGDTGAELGSVPMPAGASSLVPYGDTGNMLVVDPDHDRLELLE